MLPCILREDKVNRSIVENRKETFRQLSDYYRQNVSRFNEIIIVGSGSSNTSSVTAFQTIEKFSGIITNTMMPNLFMNKTVYNRNALYVFVSQTGSSALTQSAVIRAREQGCVTVAISEAPDTKVAKEADLFVNMGSGFEEYGQRTIGFCATVLTEMLMGLELGLINGHLSQDEYDGYVAEAFRMCDNVPKVIESADRWIKEHLDSLSSGENYMIFGPKSLYGVAMEGALKILEVVKKFGAVGYEMDDGLHGPNMGMTDKTRIIVLSDGVSDQQLAHGIARYIKNEVGTAYIAGKNVVDDSDFRLDFVTENFLSLEFAPFVQLLAYRLAEHLGVEVPLFKDMVLPDQKYFNTHTEHLGK